MKVSKSRLRLLFLVGSVVAIMPLAVPYSYKAISEAVSFTAVSATVISMQDLCRVQGTTPEAQSQLDANSPWARGAWAPCEATEAFLKNGSSRFHKLELFVRDVKEVVIIEYIAPSDQSRRVAQMQKPVNGVAFVRLEKDRAKGRKVQIRAHRSEPEQVMW